MKMSGSSFFKVSCATSMCALLSAALADGFLPGNHSRFHATTFCALADQTRKNQRPSRMNSFEMKRKRCGFMGIVQCGEFGSEFNPSIQEPLVGGVSTTALLEIG